MYWINGEPRQQLPLTDRAIQFGDGFFTTARIRTGQIDLLSYHLERLAQAADRLMFASPDWTALEREMRQVAEQRRDGVLKVIISRGSGGRGYSAAGCGMPLRIISYTEAPAHYPLWRRQGVNLTLSPVRLGCNPQLAGIKHLNRLEQILIRTRLEQVVNAQEAVVLDIRGYVTECCAANIFWRQGSEVFTPSLTQSGVAGVMRRHIMALLAGSPFTPHLVEAPPEALSAADEVIVCNALMPVLPVNRFDERAYRDRTLFEFLRPNC
ncbi:aminodeoxychorismate lyase [Sodalis sp. dw_96]|uniref:aminodeoxychorismate lyase n=1 Tax=Sodalis sp. dw_96 TaxID=2719794 RepID=UPI001BD6C44A|nr:aminodeoxychorismate lyase [Sodalis sp. dw_96]